MRANEMIEHSDALRLAEYLENGGDFPPTLLDAAAELRRLEIQRDALLEALKFYENAGSELSRLVAQRDQLLAALKRYHRIIAANMVELDVDDAFEQASAAIEAAEERPIG